MKMKKKLMLLIIVLFVCNIYSQTFSEMINGPIKGYTYLPEAKTFDFAAGFSSRKATSFWDIEGKETSYSYIYGGEIDPELSWNTIYLSCIYSINSNLSLIFGLPIIINQKLEANAAPGFEQYYPDLTGQTGIGDIIIGSEYLISQLSQLRTTAGFGFKFASGSSPEDIGETEFSSTGSGYTSIDFYIDSDVMLNPNILLSASLGYIINNKATFSYEGYSWDEKEGNVFSISGRSTFNVSSNIGLGVRISYSSAGEDKFEGEKITNSSANMFFLQPMIGYQVLSNTYKINFFASYRYEISGKNYAKANGIWLGISFFK
jgi:hypothetical protein